MSTTDFYQGAEALNIQITIEEIWKIVKDLPLKRLPSGTESLWLKILWILQIIDNACVNQALLVKEKDDYVLLNFLKAGINVIRKCTFCDSLHVEKTL